MSTKIQRTCGQEVQAFESASAGRIQDPLVTGYCSGEELRNLGYKPTKSQIWEKFLGTGTRVRVIPSQLFSTMSSVDPSALSEEQRELQIPVEKLSENIQAELNALSVFESTLNAYVLDLRDPQTLTKIEKIVARLKNNRLSRGHAYTNDMNLEQFRPVVSLLLTEFTLRNALNHLKGLSEESDQDMKDIMQIPGADRYNREAEGSNNNTLKNLEQNIPGAN